MKNTTIFDKDLNPVLEIATQEDLDTIVEYLKTKFSENLTTEQAYKINFPDHTKYADLIAKEIRDFGGNSFVNIFRGEGPTYFEIVCDVASKIKAPYNKSNTVEMVEESIMATILENAWNKMTDAEKEVLLNEIGKANMSAAKGFTAATFQAVFRAGGFASYQLMLVVANGVSKAILGRGLSLAANAALARTASLLVGPIGWALTIIWTLVDIAGPAYKVTIPCVVQVAMLRKKYNSIFCSSCEAMIPNDTFKFCPECGAQLQQNQ